MADKPNPYRFTIRDLLLATAGLGVLLFVWKSQGIYLAGSLTITLIAGGLFLMTLRKWPIPKWKSPFLLCSLLSIGNVILCLYITHGLTGDRWSFMLLPGNPPSWTLVANYRGDLGVLNSLIALLNSTSLIVCFVILIKYSRWNLFAPLWILFNLAFISLLIHNFLPNYGREVGEKVATGYYLGVGILLLPIVVRWIQKLPTERYEIPVLTSESEDSKSQQVKADEADKPSSANMDVPV